MKFRVGQTVMLINNNGMVASIGATAVVTGIDTGARIGMKLIDVEWKTHSNNQMNGGYQLYHFKAVIEKGDQLLFSFMEQ